MTDENRDGSLNGLLRVVVAMCGVGLLVCGAVAAFVVQDGLVATALVVGGFALLFVGYFGDNITRLRWGILKPNFVVFKTKQLLL